MENVNAKFTEVIYTKITDSLFPELKKKKFNEKSLFSHMTFDCSVRDLAQQIN
jgi:hypothetical protein